MRKLIMTKGLPASGKTTWAKSQLNNTVKRINKDDLRAMVDDGKWSPDNENMIITLRDNMLVTILSVDGMTAIVDDTNLCPKHEMVLRGIAKAMGAEFEIKDFTNVPLETCLERDRNREHPVGDSVILKMYSKYLEPVGPVSRDPELKDIYLCDIDGTLAIHNGRNPYDESKVMQDSPNDNVVWTIQSLLNSGHKIVFVSGRHEDCREDTREWLQDVINIGAIPNDQLLMRNSGDNRKDSTVKRELYENNIKGKYNVIGVFDDRNQVVKMWRDLGLTCFQVAEGDF